MHILTIYRKKKMLQKNMPMHVRHSLVKKKNKTKLRGFMITDVYSRPFRCKIKTSCDIVTCVVPWRYFEYSPFHCVTNV